MKRRWVILVGVLVAAAAFGGDAPAPADAEKQAELTAGRAALQDGLYPLAAKHFDRYLRRAATPREKSDGTLLLARALIGQEEYDEAVDLLVAKAGIAPDAESAAAFVYWQARAQFEKGDCAAALKVLENFPARFPENPYEAQASRLRLKCLVALKQYDEALPGFEEFQKKFADAPDAPENLLDWAGTLMITERRDEATKLLARLIGAWSNHTAVAQARLWMGDLYAERMEWDAVDQVLRPLATQPEGRADQRAAAWFAIARACDARTNMPAALDALEQGSKLAPDAEFRLRGDVARARLLVRMGRVDDGSALMRSAVKAMPSETQAGAAQLDFAQMLLDQKLYEKSLDEFQSYLEAFSDRDGQPKALMGKGWSLWELRRYAEAAPVFEKAANLSADPPAKSRALLKAADSYFANRQYKLAIDRYGRLIRSGPSNEVVPQAQFQIAESMARQGARAEAETQFLALASSGGPFANESYLRVAQIKEEDGLWDQALSTYDRILAGCSNSTACAEAIRGRGLIRYRLGQFQESLNDFNRVVEEYPDSPVAEQAFFMRGWCLYLLGNDEDALKVCQQFLEKYPNSTWAPDVLFWLGEYSFNHGDYDGAENRFLALADKYPTGQVADSALFWAGRAAAQKKQFLNAIEHYNLLTKMYPESPRIPETRFAQGDALSELGQFAGAILAFEEIIKKYPDSGLVDLAWGRKGDCQFTLGKDDPKRYQEALTSYQSLLDSPRVSSETKQQAEYKIGRCEEKLGQTSEAFERYMNVVYSYLQDAAKNQAGSPLWFTRAAFGAAAIKEAEGQWREAVNIYRRVADANVPGAAEAQARIQKIRTDKWNLF